MAALQTRVKEHSPKPRARRPGRSHSSPTQGVDVDILRTAWSPKGCPHLSRVMKDPSGAGSISTDRLMDLEAQETA